MIDIVKRFFSNGSQTDTNEQDGGSVHDLRVATCALFLEIGRIDEAFTPEELETLVSILKDRYGLSEENADALIREADRELENSVDYWQFANLINRNYSVAERIGIVETLWHIVFVDGKMDRYEHYLMNKLGKLLRLTHQQLIDAKMRVLYPNGRTAEN